jgi:hypothetical protein
MAELEEGTGTEASDSQLLEKLDSSDPEGSSRYVVSWPFILVCVNCMGPMLRQMTEMLYISS